MEKVEEMEENLSTLPAPSPKQVEAAFVLLKTIKNFQSLGTYGVSYTELAKHLFIAKQEKFEVRTSFDYPAYHPTSPGIELMDVLDSFVSRKLITKNSVATGHFFKLTQKGIETLEGIEASLERLTSGPDTLLSLDELHKRIRKRVVNAKSRSTLPIMELQRKEVNPLVLTVLRENRLIYIDKTLKSLNRADLLVTPFEELEDTEIISASESAIECIEGNKKQRNLFDQKYEFGKKGEIVDFTLKLMYGLEKFQNSGFLAKPGEIALLYAPIQYDFKSDEGYIYTIGTKFKRKILVCSDAPLSINVGHHREVFVLALIKEEISKAIAIGIPARFFDEIDFRSDGFCEETLDRMLSVIRPHLNMGESNHSLRRFYETIGITNDEKPEEATAKIMLWLQKNIGILDIAQLGIDDPYPEFEHTIEGRKPKGYVNNCKEFAALVAILVYCLPVINRPQLFVQFCKVKSGRSHVRICIKRGNGLLLPLDLEYTPEVAVLLTRQIGGKKVG